MARARIGQLDDRALPFISGLVNGEDSPAAAKSQRYRPAATASDAPNVLRRRASACGIAMTG